MSQRDPVVPLRHMLDHARKATRIVAGRRRSQVESDDVLVLALTRLLEILGEAATRVSPDLRSRYPSIPWKSVVGLRNVLIHGYDSIDMDILWRILAEDLPAILPALERAVEEESRARP